MKRLISFAIAAVITASVFASCSTVNNIPSAMTLASSDAEKYADWLTDRLGTVENNVILGIGSSEKYGIDMTAFEEDGYILKTVGDSTIVFGKTEDGLDRAVRAYAKTVENGTVHSLDTVYHEGYRIEKLTVNGIDISEYSVVYENTVKNVGNEIARLIEIACGVKLPVYSAEEAPADGPLLIARQIDDPTLDEMDGRYYEKDGNVIFEGDDNYIQGVANAVHLFFQNECGWDDLVYGDSVLRESEHINAVVEETVECDLLAREWYQSGANKYELFRNDRSQGLNLIGRQQRAHHGMASWIEYSGNHWDGPQICYTDDGVYDEIYGKIVNHLTVTYPEDYNFVKDPAFIDVSHLDNENICICNGCIEIFTEEGGTYAGPVVRWVNRLAEDLNALGYEDIQIGIFAYSFTKVPCKTKLHEDVYVTFCFDGACGIHSLTSGECTGSPWNRYAKFTHTNADYTEWLAGWCELSDHIFLYYYMLDHNFHQYFYLHQFYDDMSFFSKFKIDGFYVDATTIGLGLSRVMTTICNSFNIDPDMTEEEYWKLAYRLLEKEYGDGWEYVLNFIELHDYAETTAGMCIGNWNYGYTDFPYEYNFPYYRENYRTMLEYLEKAKSLANTERQERNAELLMISVLYVSCGIEYFDVKASDDTKAMAELEARYAEMISLAKEHGVSFDNSEYWYRYAIDKTPYQISEDIHFQADNVWAGMYEIMGMAHTE